jgi:hypothetical protein
LFAPLRHIGIARLALLAPILAVATRDAHAQRADSLLAPPDSIIRIVGAEDLGSYRQQLAERSRAAAALPDTSLRASDDLGGGVYRLEIDGLVVDETLTKLGRDFYDLFYRGWHAPPDAVNYTITLAEQPVPNLGTRVSVRVNDEIAFSANLQPRYETIETAARRALYYTARALTNRRQPPTDIY